MLDSSANSPCHSDADDDADSTAPPASTAAASADRWRREQHLQSEQKRRDSIKLGYDRLFELVAPVTTGGKAPSKATILQRSIRHMEALNRQREAQRVELETLRKEATALTVMEDSYRRLLASGRLRPSCQQSGGGDEAAHTRVPDALKLAVFRGVMDALFESFDRATGAATFAELSGTTVAWLEDACRPQVVRELCDRVMLQVLSQYQQ